MNSTSLDHDAPALPVSRTKLISGRFIPPWSAPLLIAMAATLAIFDDVVACPFCVAVSNTLTDGLRETSAAVLAECIVPATERPSRVDNGPIHQFRIVELIKGSTNEFPGSLPGARIEAFSNVPFSPGQLCLLLADTESPQPWNTPLGVTPESAEYLRGLAKLPTGSTQRLRYFLP